MASELHIISLGAGVQSSTMLLMALHGELTPLPAAAIFADTGNEPKAVYEWLEYLEKVVAGRIPIRRVSAGNITADLLRAVERGEKRCSQAPFMVTNGDGPPGRLWRKCTIDYKLTPIRRGVRAL